MRRLIPLKLRSSHPTILIVRRPAQVIEKMMEVHSSGRPLEGIFHWQGDECLTKYDMVQAIAELTHLDASAVAADTSAPKFPRPEDSRLDCSRLIQEALSDKRSFLVFCIKKRYKYSKPMVGICPGIECAPIGQSFVEICHGRRLESRFS